MAFVSYIDSNILPGVVTRVCDLSTWEAEEEVCHKSKASLGSVVSLRPAWTVQQDSVSKKQKKKKKSKILARPYCTFYLEDLMFSRNSEL